MKIELAKTAGFCFGVRRAVETVYEQVKHHQGEKIYTYGPIIHNEEVIKDLRRQGVEVINSEEELEKLEEGVVIIRSHGVPQGHIRQTGREGFRLRGCYLPLRKENP